ncbi:MAG: class I SAM-dependent methyltransferase [Sulfitobacter sp.]|nr:class I SAM-dependent methyltransferase [Sulfitobacter sp.]
MKDAATFWDRAAAKYAASPISNPEAYEATLARTRSYLKPDMRVLEIGSGTGSTALELIGEVTDLLGTDISPEMVRLANDKATAAGMENLRFAVTDAAGAVALAEDRDAVLAFNILHLVKGAAPLLASLHETMPKGGLLISKTPCIADPSIGVKRHFIAAAIPVLQLLNKAPFVQRLTFSRLEDMIRAAGFEILEIATGPAMSRYIVARKRT